jgi:hypothetical protein
MFWNGSARNARNRLFCFLQAADRERRWQLLAGDPALTGYRGLAVSTFLTAVIVTLCLAFPATGYELKHPELNAWYESGAR